MHLVIDCQHLCVTLICVVRAHLVDGALGDDLVRAADNVGVVDLVAAWGLRVCHRTADTRTRRAVKTVLLVDITQARNANHVFVHSSGVIHFCHRTSLGQEQTKLRRASWERILVLFFYNWSCSCFNHLRFLVDAIFIEREILVAIALLITKNNESMLKTF